MHLSVPLVAALGILILCSSARPLPGQALTGTTGLVTVPTAEMPDDGSLIFGVHLMDRSYHPYDRPVYRDHPVLVQSATVAFLPFVEIGLRATRILEVPRQGIGDRGVSARVRVLNESEILPAVVVGGQDLVGTRLTHALYVVASKHVREVPHVRRVGVHVGFGGDWLSLKPGSRALRGVFGGVSLAPHPNLHLLLEHDTRRINTAVRFRFHRVQVLGAMHNLDGFSAGISYTHSLM